MEIKFESLLKNNRAMITGIIAAELLQGIKNFNEEIRIMRLLTGIPAVEIITDLWVKAGMLSSSLRKKGIIIPLTDIAIASTAIEHNLSIFTFDKHFEQIPGVKIYKSS